MPSYADLMPHLLMERRGDPWVIRWNDPLWHRAVETSIPVTEWAYVAAKRGGALAFKQAFADGGR